MKKITIIAHDNYGAREIFDGITSAYEDIKFQLVLTEGLYYRKSFISSVFKMIREASFRFCFNRFLEVLRYKLDKNIEDVIRGKLNCVYFKTNDVNSDLSIAKISSFCPDLIISTFTMHIVGREVINIPQIATIGTHPSILPSYRGLEVFFWQLANGEKESGVSVFYLDEKIDSGSLILLERFSIINDTVDSLYKKLTKITTEQLNKAVEMLLNGKKITLIKTEEKNSYFKMPTKEAYRKFVERGCRWK
jgi:methionyl-tRNA formyltransferase